VKVKKPEMERYDVSRWQNPKHNTIRTLSSAASKKARDDVNRGEKKRQPEINKFLLKAEGMMMDENICDHFSVGSIQHEPDDLLICDHVNRSLVDNKNFDLYEERLIEDGINQVDRKKKELLAYVNHLNEIADSNKYQYQIKKGGKVKFPEPSFTVLTKETKRLIKKKFLPTPQRSWRQSQPSALPL